MKVTAICPTHNRRLYIPQTIASFLSQTVTDSELIILDDGTDSVSDLIPDNTRIKYIRLEGPGLSTGVKRNICCEQAQGEFIVHFDDDDWSASGRIAHQTSCLISSQKQVMTYYNIPYWNVDTRKLYIFHPVYRGTPHGASFCYRKDWWAQHKFEDNCLEDTEFGYAAERAGQFLGVDAEKFMVVRAHSSNHCVTALSMGKEGIPETDLRELPVGCPLNLTPPDQAAIHGLTSYQNGTLYGRNDDGTMSDEVLMVYAYRFKGNDFVMQTKRLAEELTILASRLERESEGNCHLSYILS